MDDIMIEAKGIKRCFRLGSGEDFYALKGIDMQVPAGKLTILKGRSGSGKTTLLNILSALDDPTEGDVIIGEHVYSQMNEKEKEKLRRYNIGFVFQSVALIPIMSAYENVDFGLRLAEYEENRDARIREVLDLVGLSSRMTHFPNQMSGGEQQRVAIARAVAHKPKVIFADEPTGALDTASGLAVMKLFQELVYKEGITIVMTTHDPKLMELGDVVYEIEDGEIVGR
ncbi:ABC transporter ATP-binding protein [Coprococcus eutactus]|uniref:ABC transporter ATP-binding protein n=1 Tax=Coprococcus eutactus TaxID=33043 RepID=A0A412IUC6_9FIRM|nr:ABC transporter ATP-binding protein [Coprococcus eutactus]